MIEQVPPDVGLWCPTLALERRARMRHPAFALEYDQWMGRWDGLVESGR